MSRASQTRSEGLLPPLGRPPISPFYRMHTYLGDKNHFDIRVFLLQEVVGDVEAGVGASQDDYGLDHFYEKIKRRLEECEVPN